MHMQVKQCSGGYIDAPYIPNAVLVNLGALMQRWTADTYLATVSNAYNTGLLSSYTEIVQCIMYAYLIFLYTLATSGSHSL